MSIFLATEHEGLSCPACGQKAMSRWSKASLGPVMTHPCAHCKARLSVSLSSSLILISPCIVAVVGLLVLGDSLAMLSLSVVALVVTFVLLYVFWMRVPLVLR